MVRRASFWVFLVCFLLALSSGFYVSQQLKQAKHMVYVVKALNNIPPYTLITGNDLEVSEIPASGLNQGAYQTKTEAVGTYSKEFIPAGVQVSTQMVFRHASTPTELLNRVAQPGQVEVSIPLQSNDIGPVLRVGDNILISDGSSHQGVITVPATVLQVVNPTLIYVLMNEADYNEILTNLQNVRLELPPTTPQP